MFGILWWNETQDSGQKKKNKNKFWNENVVKVKE